MSTAVRRRSQTDYADDDELLKRFEDSDDDDDDGDEEERPLREAEKEEPRESRDDEPDERREDLEELRWLEEAATMLLERDPRLTTQWLTIWRIAPPILVLAIFIIVFSFTTTQDPLAYFYIIIAVVSTSGLTIVSFLQYYTAAFIFLAYQLAAAFYAMYQFIAQMNDVLTCASVHCDHGKKWIYTTNWVLQGFSVGAFLIACRAIVSLLSVHSEIQRGIYAGPSRTILDPEPVTHHERDMRREGTYLLND